MRLPLVTIAILSGLAAQEPPVVTFGTTVASSSGFRGQVYQLKKDTDSLPNLERMRPVATLYTTSIDVPPQDFNRGFPGLNTLIEWFGIQYTGKIWIEKTGRYGFTLLSDDGAELKVDGKLLIDNDGIHEPAQLEASAVLTRGVHELRVRYFQGPRYRLALVLSITPPGETSRVLDTSRFGPPADPALWISGKIHSIKAAENAWPAGPIVNRRPTPALGK